MCTYDECTEPDTFFSTREKWVEHEAQSHRSTWLCPDCGLSSSSRFNEREDFERHLETSHGSHYEKRDILSAAKYARSGGAENRSCCPICSCNCDCSHLESHLADHLEVLALIALHDLDLHKRDHTGATTGAEEASKRLNTGMLFPIR